MTSTELWYKTTTNWGGKNLHRHKNILGKRKKTQHQQNDVEASSNKWKSCHFLQKKEKPRLFGCVAYHYCWNCCSSHPRKVVLSELTTSQKYYPVSPRAGLRSTALVEHSSFSQCWFGKHVTLGCVCVLHVAEREKHSAAEVAYKKIPLITIM